VSEILKVSSISKKYKNYPVVLDSVRELEAGETVDLTEDIQVNYDFFESGPGYGALD